MKIINRLVLMGTILLSVSALSCKNGLLPYSIGEEVIPATQTTLKEIECPVMVKATSGGKQKIDLSWGVVSKAVKYYVYAANTPFETFTKIGETTDTNYTYDINPGLTRYLKVTAVTYKGVESSDSEIVKGSSLACPSISSITTDTDDNGSITTVYWYMENVEEYTDNIRYEVYCFNGNNQVAFGFVDGSQTKDCSYTFKDLPQNTNFQFQVVAYLNSAQESSESSIMMDALTAAKQTPDAVSDLKATWATSLDSITLTFKLPEPSYIKAGNTAGTVTYEQYPLYFKVFRREAGNEDWGTPVANHLFYDGSTTGHGLASSKTDEINEWFDNYLPGTEISFDDEELSSGKEYEYKVQSYIDNYKDANISSDILSVAQTSGHTAAIPSIRTKDFQYNTITQPDSSNPENPVTLKTDAVLGFQMAWDSFGTEENYQFILATTKTDLKDKTNSVTEYQTFDSIEDLNANIKTINLAKQKDDSEELEEDKTEEGYYTFTLYIADKSVVIDSATISSASLASASAPGVLLVTPALTLPEIEEFLAVNGYKNKITLKWKTNTANNSLERYEISKNGYAGTPVTVPVSGAKTENGYTVLDDSSVESGKRYVYTLTASDGKYDLPSDPVTAETLGTPEPLFETDKAKHDSITVLWNKVQQADTYSIEFKNGTKSLGSFTFDPDANDNQDIIEENGVFSCRINEPEGFDDATLSGKTWTATVTAKNSTTDDSTAKNTNVFTLGPAAVTELNADVALSKNSIRISWKTVPGAKAYAVRRAKCAVSSTATETSVDIYTVPANGGKVKANGSDVDACSAELSEGKLILTDTYKTKPAENATSWDKNQDELAWGFPYKYTVFPLEDSEELETEEESSTAVLGNITYYKANDSSISKTGSCIGYGHKVTASKSEDPKYVFIKWDLPYGADEMTPYLWQSPAGKNEWTANGKKANSGNKSFTVELTGQNRTKAFDYAVTYNEDCKPNQTYFDDLAKTKDTVCEAAKTESINKGYAFAITLEADNVPDSTGTSESFSESFSWKIWDYSERAVGPDSDYVLSIFNNDYSTVSDTDDGWRKIADISKDGTVSINNIADYNVDIVINGSKALTVTPKEADSTDGTYSGLLKNMRDFRHFARLLATRTTTSNGLIYTSNAEDPKSLYAYRKWTDGEWIKAAMLAYASGFNTICSGGVWSKAPKNTTQYGDRGNIKILKDWGTISYSFTKWNPEYTNKIGYSSFSLVTLNTEIDKNKLKSDTINESKYTTSISEGTISVTSNSDFVKNMPASLAASFNGSFNISSTGSNNATIKYQRTDTNTTGTLSASTSDERRKLIPIRYDGESYWWFNNSQGSTYGWW